jgi:hypothetical protein
MPEIPFSEKKKGSSVKKKKRVQPTLVKDAGSSTKKVTSSKKKKRRIQPTLVSGPGVGRSNMSGGRTKKGRTKGLQRMERAWGDIRKRYGSLADDRDPELAFNILDTSNK